MTQDATSQAQMLETSKALTSLISPASSFDSTQASPMLQDSQPAQLSLPEVPMAEPPGLISLSALRAQQHYSIDTVAGALCLSVGQIHSIESKDWSALPAAAYVKGFLKNYCRFLNVDPQPYIDEFTQDVNRTQAGNQNAGHSKPAASASARPLAPSSTPSEQTHSPIKDDRRILSTYSQSTDQESQARLTTWAIASLIASTVVFFAVWEHALWLPKVQAFFAPMQHHALKLLGQETLKNKTSSSDPLLPQASMPVASPQTSADLPSPTQIQSPTGIPNTALDSATPSAAEVGVNSTVTTNSSALALSPTVTVAVSPSNASNTNNSAANPAAGSSVTPNSPGVLRVVSFSYKKNVWVELKDGKGKVLSMGTKKQGAQETFKAISPITVVIGASDALTMAVDGKVFDHLAVSQGNVSRLKID